MVTTGNRQSPGHLCPTCSRTLVWNTQKTYMFCKDHPNIIVYDKEQAINKQNNDEWESLRRLESGE